MDFSSRPIRLSISLIWNESLLVCWGLRDNRDSILGDADERTQAERRIFKKDPGFCVYLRPKKIDVLLTHTVIENYKPDARLI
jgi:hypothetical protein